MTSDERYPHLTRYTRPSNFADWADFDRREYFVVAGQHRDSDTLARSNFRSTLRRLGGESDTVIIVRDSHWAVGYVEEVYVHQSDDRALAIADQIRADLEDYPVVDEDDWSELEYETAAAYWAGMSVRDRLDWCRRYDVSIFAARRPDVPEDRRGELIAALAE